MTPDTAVNNRVWFDATGCFNWGAQFPTGVPRVEFSLVEQALVTDGVGIAYLDTNKQVYVSCNSDDRQFLADLVAHHSTNNTGLPPFGFYWKNLRSIVRHSTKETHRVLAALITKRPKRDGAVYQFAKFVVRLALKSTHAVAAITRAGRKSDRVPSGSKILISHAVDRKNRTVRAIQAEALKPAYVVYDVIPLVRPDLARPALNKDFKNWLSRANDEHAEIFAISKGTSDDLKKWLTSVGRDAKQNTIHAFPLTGMGLSVEGDEREIDGVSSPFVMYVSTFNQRKNHDFLIDLWVKLQEKISGQKLPQLVLIGREPPSSSVMAALRRAHEANVDVHLPGGVGEDQLRWAYKNCRFTVFPSSYEGWGLGASESLMFGKACFVTDNAQLVEATQNLMPSAPEKDMGSWSQMLEKAIADENYVAGLEDRIGTSHTNSDDQLFARSVIATLMNSSSR